MCPLLHEFLPFSQLWSKWKAIILDKVSIVYHQPWRIGSSVFNSSIFSFLQEKHKGTVFPENSLWIFRIFIKCISLLLKSHSNY